MTTFTASEVRDQAEWLSSVSVIGTGKTCQILLAYADRLEADERTEPVMWVDPTTFCDAYPNCVKKLSFMSSDDEDAGVEYVALYTHPAQAQPPAANVTDEMVERARSAFVQADDGSTGITDAIRAALLAAQKNPNG